MNLFGWHAFRLLLMIVCLVVCAYIHAAEPSAKDLDALATKQYQQGHYSEAIQLEEQALAILEKTVGPENPGAAQSVSNLGLMYMTSGAYDKAEPLLQRALAIYEKGLGPEHQYTAVALNNLAQLYRQTGAYAKAEPLYQRALAILEKAVGPEHPSTATALDNLAELYRQTGAYVKAEPLYQRSLGIREKALGAEHPDTALSLNNLAILYQATGAYAKAEPLLQRALAIYEKTLGSENPKTAAALNNLASLYKASGAYAKAEPLYKRALAIYEKAFGPENPGTAQLLNNLANLYEVTGAYARAEPLLQRALAIREKALGPEHRDTAESLNNLAVLYKATGAYTKAEPLFQRSLAIIEKALGPEHPDTAAALNNLAELYRQTGAYVKAEPLYQRSLRIREKALGPEHPDTAASLNNLANLYEDTGAYAKAEPLLQRSLEIRQKALGPEHPGTAIGLNNLAALYKATGAYTKAEPLYQQSLAILEKALGPVHPDTATALNNLAEVYQDTGAYANAEPLYQRALAIRQKALGAAHPDTALSLNDLASVYQDTGRYAKAEPLYQRALEIQEKTLGPEHPRTADALNQLARLYAQTGAFAKAEPLYQRALAINEKVLGPEHPSIAGSLNNLAELYQYTGAYAKAEPLLQRAIAVQGKTLGPEHPNIATILTNLAVLYDAAGDDVKAQPLWRRAGDIEESNTRLFLLAGSEARQQAYLQRRTWTTFVNVSIALADPSATSIALGLTSVLQYKGRVLDSISDSGARLRRSVALEDQSLLAQLSAIAQQRSTLTYSPPPNLSYKDTQVQIGLLVQKQEKLETDLSSRSATFRQNLTPITMENVRQATPLGAVLVEWLRYQPFDPKKGGFGAPRYVAFLLKRTGEPAAIDLGSAQQIEDLVAEYTRVLSDPANTSYADVAKDLSAKLVKPLLPHLTQGNKLLLSPDAALNLVPFAALVDEHGEYLAKHFEITYLTSGRDLLHLADASPARSSAVVLADPNYGPLESPGKSSVASIKTAYASTRSVDLDRSGLEFKPLPGTVAEAQALRSLLKLDGQHVLTGDQATEARLRQLHGPRILHMATHAFFLNDQELAAVVKPRGLSPDDPVPVGENPMMRAGLALAGANQRRSGAADDGILTAAEVAQLDLLGTQLVVLSACETGVGTVQQGDGVYGLRRALVLAGAQAQLVSLWKVADNATQEMMLNYYRGLLQGQGRSEALRKVQVSMMAEPKHQHPYFWASFIPIGDWRPLTH